MSNAGPVVPSTVPRTEAEIDRAAAALSLPIPPACMPGVIATLAVLDGHAATLLGSQR